MCTRGGVRACPGGTRGHQVAMDLKGLRENYKANRVVCKDYAQQHLGSKKEGGRIEERGVFRLGTKEFG